MDFKFRILANKVSRYLPIFTFTAFHKNKILPHKNILSLPTKLFYNTKIFLAFTFMQIYTAGIHEYIHLFYLRPHMSYTIHHFLPNISLPNLPHSPPILSCTPTTAYAKNLNHHTLHSVPQKSECTRHQPGRHGALCRAPRRPCLLLYK